MARRGGGAAKRRVWRGVLARQRRSGLSIRQFCLREGFSEPSFYWWRRALARPTARTTRAASRLRPPAVQFAPVTLSPASHNAAYEVVFSDGVRVLVHTTAGEKLGDVVNAVRAASTWGSPPC
jgi:hypothetical protein